MCGNCGNPEHYNNNVIQKALDKGLKEKPRFKIIETLESEFKSDFAINVAKTIKELDIKP